jgi:5-hydroxyisourate hydrolase
MPGMSLHVVDVARGKPATGMRVDIARLSPDPATIATGTLASDGTLHHAVTTTTLIPGTYEVIFHAGTFFAGSMPDLTAPPFLDHVPFRFNLTDPTQHYHLPLKITPWGFCLYRGA